ncbi:MAG TPA: DEAD/DEAH box helicase family protein, partial [Legionellaceae bacterium]|nr:DEAD/DEAH box helicase family protein [Legionellaceae bacterium]
MKLSNSQKTQLIKAATQVYESYLALDFFKNKCFQMVFCDDNGFFQGSLFDYCKVQCTEKSQFPRTITLQMAGKSYDLQMYNVPADPPHFQCILRRSIALPVLNELKFPHDYREEEICQLFDGRVFMLTLNPNGIVDLSLSIDNHISIGGAGKKELYRTHLVTLYNIIQKIKAEAEITNLLVALPTGSGKTFIQALWLYILHIGKFTGIFAVPNHLIAQFQKDIKRLLPDTIVDCITILQDHTHAQRHALDLSVPGKMILASNHCLLDVYYHDVLKNSAEQVLLSFDEQHLIMRHERRSKRLLTLTDKFLSLFLTATPDPYTYQLSGSRPVAIMSSAQKAKAGQGQFPMVFTLHCAFLRDYNKQCNFSYKEKWINGFLLSISDSFQPECSSAAKMMIDRLPYLFQRKANETDLRWCLQVPMARKILWVVGDNESLVNLCSG